MENTKTLRHEALIHFIGGSGSSDRRVFFLAETAILYFQNETISFVIDRRNDK